MALYTSLQDQLWGSSSQAVVTPTSTLQAIGESYISSPSGMLFGGLTTTYTAPQPSLWESFISPFKKTGSALVGSMPTVAESLGQGLHDILIAKFMTPKATKEQTGTVINYDRPQAGISPLVIPVGTGSSGTSYVPVQSTSSTGISLGVMAIITIIVGLFLFWGKK